MTKRHLQEYYIQMLRRESSTGYLSPPTNISIPKAQESSGLTLVVEDLTPWVREIGMVNPDYHGRTKWNAIIDRASGVFDKMVREGRSELIPLVAHKAREMYPVVASNIGFYAAQSVLSASR